MAMCNGCGEAKAGRWMRWPLIALLLLCALPSHAQVEYPLNANGVMAVTLNGEFVVAEDDLSVKVPGGYVRINRDFDGVQWTLNRQWSGLHTPGAARAFYASVGTYMTCTIYNGINSCDTGSGAMYSVPGLANLLKNRGSMRVLNDEDFNGGQGSEELPHFVTRKGVGFTLSTDKTSYSSNDHPRFIVRPQSVLKLPDSTGPDAHPVQANPRLTADTVRGFRWNDRSGQWIEYDNQGRIASYGDRNDVRVWFQYGSHGQLERVLDDNGRTVFTLLYSDAGAEFVSEVRDHTPLDGSVRRVRYEYDDDQLVRVIDARGNTTHLEYSGAKLSKVVDAAGRTTVVHYNAPPIPRSGYRVGTGGGSGGGGSRVAVSGDGLRGEQQRRLTKIVASDGGETEIQYDYDRLKKEFSMTVRHPETPSGRRLEHLKVDIDGRLVSYEVNGNVLLSSTGSYKNATYTDERGNQTSITRDAFGEVTGKTFPDGTRATVTYEAGSLDVRQFVDEAGTITRASYDARGNPLRIETAVGKAEQQTLSFEVNTRGETTKIVREGGLNVAGDIDPDVELQLAYDGNGNVTSLTDGEGHTWNYVYDERGNLLEATDPLGYVWAYGYDAHGSRNSVTDPNGLIWQFVHDGTGRVLSVTDARGQTTQVSYDPAGRLETLTNPLGASRRRAYDAVGRIVGVMDEVDQRLSVEYDAQGRLTALADGEGNVTSLRYADVDGLDRGGALASSVRYPTFQQSLRYNSRLGMSRIDELVDGTTRSTQLGYDARGFLTSFVDAYDVTQSGEYDALGRPTKGTDALGNTVTFTYDNRGNVVRLTDRRGKVTRLEYDRRDLLVRETNPLGQATQYSYDDAGRLQGLQRANGVRLEFDYDPGNRLVARRSYTADGSLELTDTFNWDDGNRLSHWGSQGASGVRTYDNADRLLSESVTIDGVTLARQYTYYANGQVRTLTGPNGVTLSYFYDSNGALSRVEIPGEGAISVTDRSWTAATRIVLPGGTVQEIERDGLLNPTRLRVRSPNQTTLFEQQSEYGALHEELRRTTQGLAVDYTYDDALQLTRARPSSGNTETFELDAAGNRLADNVVAQAWQYDDSNRLLLRGTFNYQYDAAGNLIRKTDTSRSDASRMTTFAYDGYNRVTEVRDAEGELVARYAYDPFGHRISKEVTAIGAANGGTLGKRLFLHANSGVLAETDATGNVLTSYGWQPEGIYGTAPLFMRTVDGHYYYYHNDPLGQPWLLTNKAGAVVWQASRTQPFGTVFSAPGAQVEQPWRLPGQYLDGETGLHYNLHRYYDPATGRYITEDPIGFVGGLNFYLYANASPTRYIDPTGEFPWLLVVPIIYGAIELGSFLYDLYHLHHTFNDPCATGWDRTFAVGAVAAGILLPGGGYGAAGNAARGRLGNQATRDHVDQVATELERRGWTITHGGGRHGPDGRRLPEEYLPGAGGGRTGSSYPDITATRGDRTLRVNTVDTRADGVTPTTRETRNAARIRSQTPGDHLVLIPKPKNP
ncbi:RHS domain-containing protein [Luteimonas sp. BDR2-5]|uniref:RHS repeat-associated core domain-containing protein n=1 Tax=Proluteimonas luteida TaxID=2878685 RepID=UPI001E5C2B6A|nr:RHS repeat-associated core domain-containing protein [Luteimonas sp. BDR2-5]MCD9026837.1 RHS domain-containing protein [Luteimonas sp. BDR2-5]